MKPLITRIDLLKLASGDTLSLQVYKFIGQQPGKKAYLQSNLHGGEIVGNAVIHQLIEFLSTLDESEIMGEIWLVPACNPLGTNQRQHHFSTGRFNCYDGRNWNRIFWDYGKVCKDLKQFAQAQINEDIQTIRNNFLERQTIAWEKELAAIQAPSHVPFYQLYRSHLQSLSMDANYVIDIHSSSNDAIDYIYCFPSRGENAQYFLLDYGILLTKYDGDAFDEAFIKPWLALEKQLALLGREIKFDLEAWTIELGSGMTMNPISVARGVRGIKNYLLRKEVLNLTENYSNSLAIKLFTKEQLKEYYAPTGGMIQNRVPLGSQVKKGERLYQILSFNKKEELPTVFDIYVEIDGLVFDVSINHSVNQGDYILEVMNYE